MNLPISWLAAAAIPATLVARQTTQLVGSSAKSVFGDLLHPTQQAPNGPSAAASQSKGTDDKPLALRVKDLKDRLQKILSTLKSQNVTLSDQPETVQLVADGVGDPSVEASDNLRIAFQNHLNGDPDLRAEINSLAIEKAQSDPLALLPGSNVAGKSLRIDLEV